MRILFCDNSLRAFWNFRGEVAKHFHKKGAEICLAVPENSFTTKDAECLPKYLKVYALRMNRNGSNPIDDIIFFHRLKDLFKSLHPDLIFTYTIKPNIYGSIAAHQLKIPVIAMVAGLGYVFSENSLKHRIGRFLYRLGLKKADKVIVLNESNKRTLLSGGYVDNKDLIVFRCGEGINLSQYTFYRDQYDNVKFLMVARVLYDKGYQEFVDAAQIVKRRYPNAEFELLGPLAEDSPMGVPYEVIRQHQEAGYISYLGETRDVTKYIKRNGTVSVLASKYLEGLNRSLMEACAMGRICITTEIAGCKEIVDDSVNGYLVKPHDAQELAEAMIRVIELTPAERRAMGTASRQKAEREFGVERVIDKYEEILRSL